MKNLFKFLMAVAVLFTASCAKEDISSSIVGNGEAVEVTFSANLPELGTRYGEGESATNLQYFVYEKNADGTLTKLQDLCNTEAVINGSTTVHLVLIKGMTYCITFWADNTAAPYSFDGQKVTIDYTQVKANDEKLDAFFGVVPSFNPADVNGTQVVELRRPFAQLNATTTDCQDVKNSGITKLIKSKISIKRGQLNDTFNLLTEVASCTCEDSVKNDWLTFNYNDNKLIAAENNNIEETTTQMYLSMNYLLVNGEKSLVDVKFEFVGERNGAEFPFTATTYPSIPLKRNYKTNITGKLLTKATDFQVEIKPGFEDAEIVEVWDGETVTEPASTTENNQTVYTVASGSDLAWLAAYLNGTLPATTSSTRAAVDTFNIVLDKDIELGGQEWTPIGTSANPFKGTFDGNGHIIKNLVVTGGSESNKGLFGYTTNGEVKNLTIQDAKVSGRLNVGVVAGTPYTTKYTDITVKGHIEVNGLAYVGGVGGKNAYADWTNITVDVDETSYVKAHSIENGTAYRTYVGGVVGFNGEGGHSFKNITSNINVEGSTCDVGGLFGIAHYDNKFENCVCSGNVEIYAAEEADEAQEIGGIAGVWHNQNGTTVTMTDCEFTGTLATNIEGVEFCNGGLVGKAYGDGTGVLSLNGLEITKDGVNLAVINKALATGNVYTLPFNVTGKATDSNAYGVTGLNQLNGGVLDGDGHTLKVTGAGGTWASAINTTGGTIKNITVAQGFRGIFVNHNSSHSEKVVLENVTINGPTYTISCDQGMKQGLEAYDCTINGWTSYAATIGEAYFKNCSFGKGAGYKFARPYAATEFVGCNFCEGYEIDARAKISFLNCTLNGVALTEENLATLVTGNVANASIVTKVSTADELVAALEANKSVYLLNDIKIEPASMSNAYGTTGINVYNGQTIDGAGYQLDVKGAGGTWDSGICTSGGLIKNIWVTGAFRGIFVKGATHVEKIVLDNVRVEGTTYTISIDQASKQGLEATNSIFRGWTSYAATIGEVKFVGCTFGAGNGYNFSRPYAPTTYVNCTFEAGHEIDPRAAVTFENCTFNGVALTAENLATLVTSNIANASVK